MFSDGSFVEENEKMFASVLPWLQTPLLYKLLQVSIK